MEERPTWIERRAEALLLTVGLGGLIFEAVLTLIDKKPEPARIAAWVALLGGRKLIAGLRGVG